MPIINHPVRPRPTGAAGPFNSVSGETRACVLLELPLVTTSVILRPSGIGVPSISRVFTPLWEIEGSALQERSVRIYTRIPLLDRVAMFEFGRSQVYAVRDFLGSSNNNGRWKHPMSSPHEAGRSLAVSKNKHQVTLSPGAHAFRNRETGCIYNR